MLRGAGTAVPIDAKAAPPLVGVVGEVILQRSAGDDATEEVLLIFMMVTTAADRDGLALGVILSSGPAPGRSFSSQLG